MPYRERLGPLVKVGPIEIGSKLGRVIKPGEQISYGIDSDPQASMSVKVVPGEEKPAAEITVYWKHGDNPESHVQGAYVGKAVDNSPAGDHLRWSDQ